MRTRGFTSFSAMVVLLLRDLERTILTFQERFSQLAQPFRWKFTRDDLRRYLDKLAPMPLAA
jgi:hypothetical protein